MPLLYQYELQEKFEDCNYQIQVACWDITEPEEYFRALTPLSAAEAAEIGQIKSKRRIEWWASRYLLHLLSGREERAILWKDEFGKPHLKGSDWHISLSHSHGRVMVAASPSILGIDVQMKVSQITRIAPKYMRAEELALVGADLPAAAHVYWSCKEAMYKAYGRKELDFKGNIYLAQEPKNWDGMDQSSGYILKAENRMSFQLFWYWDENYIVAIALTA